VCVCVCVRACVKKVYVCDSFTMVFLLYRFLKNHDKIFMCVCVCVCVCVYVCVRVSSFV
jgi:hypothetical protein